MEPKHKIGQTVRLKKPSLYNEFTGKIVDIEKIYAETNPDGTFKRGGLWTASGTIECIALPHTLENDVLTVTYPSGMKMVSKFKDYSFTIETPKMRLCCTAKNIISAI